MYVRAHAQCRELVPADRLTCVRTFTRLFDALATPEHGVSADDGPEAFSTMAEVSLVFLLILESLLLFGDALRNLGGTCEAPGGLGPPFSLLEDAV